MPRRGQGFSTAEVEYLLAIGQVGWEHVLAAHELKFPGMNCNVQSLQCKFSALYNHKIPTGDPNCPELVRRAKRIYKDIVKKMDISNGEDEESYEEDEDVSRSSDEEEESGTEDEAKEEEEEEEGEEVLAEPVPEAVVQGDVIANRIEQDMLDKTR